MHVNPVIEELVNFMRMYYSVWLQQNRGNFSVFKSLGTRHVLIIFSTKATCVGKTVRLVLKFFIVHAKVFYLFQ